MRIWPYATMLGFLGGCAPIVLDAGGSGDGGASSGSDAGTASSGSGGASGGVAPLVTYTGYVESFMFMSGADTFTLKLAFGADGTVTGTATFGDGAAPPPPTDPNVGYPANLSDVQVRNFGTHPYEGFVYTIVGGTSDNGRVRFSVDSGELWKAWCELQTPVPYSCCEGSTETVEYYCVPNVGYAQRFGDGGVSCDLSGDGGMPVDCGKAFLCQPNSRTCTCTATSCAGIMPIPGDIAFDLSLSGSSLDGSETGLTSPSTTDGSPRNVHLHR
jgi:hypothetical protein